MAILKEDPEEARMFAAMQAGEGTTPLAPEPVAPTPPPASPAPAEPDNSGREPAPQPRPRMVPHAALHEERTRRQKVEQELADMRAAQRSPPVAPPAPPPMPEITQDPLGAMEHMRVKIAQFEERDRRQAEEQERQRKANEQAAEVQHQVTTRVDAYAAEHPEYGEQVMYLRNLRGRELQLLGESNQSIVQTIAMEEMQLGQLALDRDLDPGELVANLARGRGWQPGNGTPQPKIAPVQQQEPQPRARVTPSPAEQQMDRIERGQRAARSPSGTGGNGAVADMTIERLASLDGAEFDKAFATWGRKLMG